MFGGNDCYNSGNGVAAYGSNVWGIIIFLLILFWVFGNRNGAFGNGGYGMPFGMGGMPFGAWGLNEHTPKDNDARLADIKATMDKDTAVLKGDLDLGFRTVLNNADNNANKVIMDNLKARNDELARENTRLYINAQNDQIKAVIGASNAELNHRLDIIQGNMLTRPPFYPQGCSPCVSNCCGGDGGCGCPGLA